MADSLALLPVSGGRWNGSRREPVAVQRGLPMRAAGQLLGAQGLLLLRDCPRPQSARRHSSVQCLRRCRVTGRPLGRLVWEGLFSRRGR